MGDRVLLCGKRAKNERRSPETGGAYAFLITGILELNEEKAKRGMRGTGENATLRRLRASSGP